MILYAESSAVLAWLFEEPPGDEVREVLAGARAIVTSAVTLVECDRAILRTSARARTPDTVSRRVDLLAETASSWTIGPVSDAQVDRARRAFPREPVRTLDALHLAAALLYRAEIPELAVLSLDERVRDNAGLLGMNVLPQR